MQGIQKLRKIFNLLKKDIAKAIIRRLRPQYLYKYRGFNASTIENIYNSELWFACPYQYNDPFDNQLDYNYNFNEDSIGNFAQLVHEIIAHIPSNALNETPTFEWVVNELKSNDKYLHNMADGIVSHITATNRICCFSSKQNNLLMWAHYADSHKGICLEFDTLKDLDTFSSTVPVQYVKKYPYLSIINNFEAIISRCILTKSKEWKYENEYRVIENLTPSERDLLLNNSIKQQSNVPIKKRYKDESLRRIIFGCGALQIGTNSNEINKIEKFVLEINKLFPHVVFTISEKVVGEFRILTDKEITVQKVLSKINDIRNAQIFREKEVMPVFTNLFEQMYLKRD